MTYNRSNNAYGSNAQVRPFLSRYVIKEIHGIQIVSEEAMEALEKAVYKYLKIGWRPQGGIAIEMGVKYQVVIKDNQ